MATNFWELLQQHQGDLTKSGRTVADYLVQHAAEAQYLSISSLAKECCVAEATVFRFCRALGFEGYHEMRIALAQANATGALVNQHVPEPDADTATLCEHASALLMTTINGTQNNLSPEAVDKASELMHKARQVKSNTASCRLMQNNPRRNNMSDTKEKETPIIEEEKLNDQMNHILCTDTTDNAGEHR